MPTPTEHRIIYNLSAQKAEVDRAGEWTAKQATRLGVGYDKILYAIRCCILYQDIERMSATAFILAFAGKSPRMKTAPKGTGFFRYRDVA